MAESIATTLLPETENKRRSSYRSIADTSFFSYFLDCVSSDLPSGSLLAFHHKAAVESVNSHQLVMRALLNDLTVIDNKNLVGMAHGFQPVGNHNDRLIVGQFCNGLHQLLLVLRVHVGGGLVQNDDRRIVMLILLIPRVKKSKNPGSIYPLYMASYGAFRFLDEFFRTSSTGMLFHLSHVWAAIAFAAGLSIYIEINARNHQRKKVIKK